MGGAPSPFANQWLEFHRGYWLCCIVGGPEGSRGSNSPRWKLSYLHWPQFWALVRQQWKSTFCATSRPKLPPADVNKVCFSSGSLVSFDARGTFSMLPAHAAFHKAFNSGNCCRIGHKISYVALAMNGAKEFPRPQGDHCGAAGTDPDCYHAKTALSLWHFCNLSLDVGLQTVGCKSVCV